MDPNQPGVLTPTVRRTLQQGLADCTSCQSKLAYLREIGAPNEELEARADHTKSVIETALFIDQQRRESK